MYNILKVYKTNYEGMLFYFNKKLDRTYFKTKLLQDNCRFKTNAKIISVGIKI